MGKKMLVFRCNNKIWAIKFMDGDLPADDKMKDIAKVLKNETAKKEIGAPGDQGKVLLAPGDHYIIFSERALVPQLQLQGMSWDTFKELVSSSDEALVRALLGIGCACEHIGESIPLDE